MSNSLQQFDMVRVREPRTNLTSKRTYAILEGGQQISWKPVISTSYSQNSVQFNCPPPNPNIIVDRQVKLVLPFEVSITGADQGSPLVDVGVTDSLRAFPIASIIESLQVNINNASVSINLADVLTPLTRYCTPLKLREFDYSMSPSMLDQHQNYSEGTGSVRNPLGTYDDSCSGADIPRGAFLPVEVVTDTNTEYKARFIVVEPLFLSPFLFGGSEHNGFYGVQTMDLNFTLAANLSRVWSHSSAGNTFSSVDVTIGGFENPQLLFNYITPSPLMPIPMVMSYPYYAVTRFPTTISNSITAGSEFQVTSANIQLNSIPRRIYIYARRSNSDADYGTTDTFAFMRSISVNWNNNSGLLSGATAYDLYRMAVNNGCNLSWMQWSEHVGSVLCIEMGKDIGLQSGLESPGSLGTYQLQLTANMINTNATETIAFSLYVVVISEGVLMIEQGRAVTELGIVSKKDVLEAASSPFINYKNLMQTEGGSWWSGISDFFTDKVGPAVKSALPYVKDAIDFGKTVKSLVGGVNVGGCTRRGRRGVCTLKPKVRKPSKKDMQRAMKDNPEFAKMVNEHAARKGSKKKSKNKKAGMLLGGRTLSRDTLRRRLLGGSMSDDESSDENDVSGGALGLENNNKEINDVGEIELAEVSDSEPMVDCADFYYEN